MKPNLNDLFIRDFIKGYFLSHRPREPELLLDLGCGGLPYAPMYADPLRRVITADIEDRAGELAVLATASALPFKSGTFDTILLSEVIEHVSDERVVLREISRVLKPGGALLITWPFMYGLHEYPYDYRRITEFGMSRLLADGGISLARLSRRGDVLGVAFTILGQLANNTAAWLSRLPVAGRALRLPAWCLGNMVYFFDMVYFRVTKNAARLHATRVGHPDRGVTKYLTSWTLGYCVVGRKPSA